jgi:hypothetical protein
VSLDHREDWLGTREMSDAVLAKEPSADLILIDERGELVATRSRSASKPGAKWAIADLYL